MLAAMSQQQRVGQLIMVGTKATGASSSTLSAISNYHVGNVILTGRSTLGIASTTRVVARLRARTTVSATAKVGLFVATDQEGGKVQVLSGPGFSTIPSALTQGVWATSTLRARAATWGRQLRSAGVNVNLAPVTDTVPHATAQSNRPIGFYQREFGFTTAVVGPHASAFVQGMQSARVAATPKHFPGLGRVMGNTDTTAGVTDSITTRTSTYLGPFRQAIAAGAPFVMMSSAYYSKIDSNHPACFSRVVVTGMLRGDLGFQGVVISDDLGRAQQVARWSAGLTSDAIHRSRRGRGPDRRPSAGSRDGGGHRSQGEQQRFLPKAGRQCGASRTAGQGCDEPATGDLTATEGDPGGETPQLFERLPS